MSIRRDGDQPTEALAVASRERLGLADKFAWSARTVAERRLPEECPRVGENGRQCPHPRRLVPRGRHDPRSVRAKARRPDLGGVALEHQWRLRTVRVPRKYRADRDPQRGVSGSQYEDGRTPPRPKNPIMKTLSKTLTAAVLLTNSLVATQASAAGSAPAGGPSGAAWDVNTQQTSSNHNNSSGNHYAHGPDGISDYPTGGYGYTYVGYYGTAWGADLAGMGAAGWALATAFASQFGCGGTTLANVYAVDPFRGW